MDNALDGLFPKPVHPHSEVLKLLGLRKYGRMGGPGVTVGGGIGTGSSGFEGKRGRKGMYGSMSSLPSVSSIGSRHIYKVTELNLSPLCFWHD